MNHAFEVIKRLRGKTLGTAESCTGGGIGAALTGIPGSSAVFKGGVISYTNEIKSSLLNISPDILNEYGAVSAEVAARMVSGVRKLLNVDIAVSVTGLAGPDGDEFGNPVGTVYIGFEDHQRTVVQDYLFAGDREAVRAQTVDAALNLILQFCE